MLPNKQQPIYVAPANPAGKALAEQLTQQGYQVIALADNLKQANNIINSAQQAQPNYAVIIAQGSFLHPVAAGLVLRGFSLAKLWSVTANHQFISYRQPLTFKLNQFKNKLLNYLFAVCRRLVPASGYVYYAEDFFDSNVLLAFREHQRQQPTKAWLLGRNIKQPIAELSSDKQVLHGLSVCSLWRLLAAKKLIVDHEYTGETFSLIRQYIPVIQLWHGLPYKALSGNIHYPHVCDEVFISSSEWFNQHIFPSIFRAKQYLALGYPRNDAFMQRAEQRDWINTEPLALLRQVQQTTGELVIYAPTYRDWGDNDYPLNLPELNQWCAQHSISFILKFHPFISRKFSDAMQLGNSNELQQLPNLPHLYLYPSGKNVYPWLAEAKSLITDYSSIAYDFLLAKKPIVYFQYDAEKYRELRGETLVADEDFICGPIVENQHQLLQMLLNDNFAHYSNNYQNIIIKLDLNLHSFNKLYFNKIIGCSL